MKNSLKSIFISTICVFCGFAALGQDSLENLLSNEEESAPEAITQGDALPEETALPAQEIPSVPTQQEFPTIPPAAPEQQPAIVLPVAPVPPAPQPAIAPQKREKKWFGIFKVNEVRARHEQELKNLKERQQQEIENQKKRQEAENKRTTEVKKKILETQTKTTETAKPQIQAREKEIKVADRSERIVEVITHELDPLYIKLAQVKKTKTKFLRMKHVDLEYRLDLVNQTPKIINFVLLTWERKISFSNVQTLSKQFKISKPLVPYKVEKFRFNEVDSKREGETYKAVINRIIFEDGTEWNNPAVAKVQTK